MNKIIIKYLEHIQTTESIFPMDSVHTGKKISFIKYGEPDEKRDSVNSEYKRGNYSLEI